MSEYGNHIIQYDQEYSLCMGCETCKLVCTLMHEGVACPSAARIQVQRGALNKLIHRVATCQQCADKPCYEACPKKGEAMCVDENGIVYVNEEKCIGCSKCAKACPFDPARIVIVKNAQGKRKAKKCDMCRTRPEGPACVQFCPSVCIGQSKDPMPVQEN